MEINAYFFLKITEEAMTGRNLLDKFMKITWRDKINRKYLSKERSRKRKR